MKKETRREQKEKTREHLMDAAYLVFSNKGIQATKTVDIAKQARVAHGTLFLHFPTRDDLLLAVVEKFGIEIGQKFQDSEKAGGTVKAVLAIHLQIVTEYEPFYASLVSENVTLASNVKQHMILIQSGIAHYLERAMQKNEEKLRRLPIPLLLNTWIGLIHYYLMHRDLFAPGESVLKNRGEELLDYFMNLLKP